MKIEQLGDEGFHVFCRIKLNGIFYRALIDTGASKSVMDKKLLSELQLRSFSLTSDHQMLGIQPGELDVEFTHIREIKLGRVKFENMVLGLLDMDHVQEQYRSLNIKPFEVIIGGDLLSSGNAVIDYGLKKLTIHSVR
ncbi:MAG: retropepsin-like domain-containing protein [Flavobacteriales bacterium]|nr:retropepsin-like domain-containing protein [Flavobacteriales bacterium]